MSLHAISAHIQDKDDLSGEPIKRKQFPFRYSHRPATNRSIRNLMRGTHPKRFPLLQAAEIDPGNEGPLTGYLLSEFYHPKTNATDFVPPAPNADGTWSVDEVEYLHLLLLNRSLHVLGNWRTSEDTLREIARWMTDDDLGPFSFRACCVFYGVDPEVIRERAIDVAMQNKIEWTRRRMRFEPQLLGMQAARLAAA